MQTPFSETSHAENQMPFFSCDGNLECIRMCKPMDSLVLTQKRATFSSDMRFSILKERCFWSPRILVKHAK